MDSIGDSAVDYDYDDDDDEIANLFSFGAADATATLEPPPPYNESPIKPPNQKNRKHAAVTKPGLSVPTEDCDFGGDNDSHASNDSFIELLENAQKNDLSLLGGFAGMAVAENNAGNNEQSRKDSTTSGVSDLQDILDWLDDDDEKGSKLLQRQEEELVFVQPPRPQDSLGSKPAKTVPSPSSQPREYDSLEQAVRCRDSSKAQIRRLLEKEKFVVDRAVRPHLWAKVVCDKTLEETLRSSLADSFQKWEQKFWKGSGAGEKDSCPTDATTQKESRNLEDDATKSNEQNGSPKKNQEPADSTKCTSDTPELSRREQRRKWLEEQSILLSERIVSVVKDGDPEPHRKALLAILVNHFDSSSQSEIQSNSDPVDSFWKDSLLPPVLCSILSSGAPPPVACVMLSQIIPSFMPILALTTKERQEATAILHQQLYLLACYHLPLLVLHLDKYLPDWYKSPPSGHLPQSWLATHLAGENGSFMDMRWLLHLWDLVLTSNNSSLRFFLVISMLDLHAERLLLLTDEDLKKEFHRVTNFSSSFDIDIADPVSGNYSEEEKDDQQAAKFVQEWSDKAFSLWEETPVAVIKKLKVLEDEAVTDALVARQKAKEKRFRLQQEAEAKALQEAREVEQERKADEARKRLTRARLVAFYRQFNPGKENNIDKIMVSYDGRYDVLDAKLKMKYGVGFNPALKPKPIMINKSNSKIFASMNTGFGHRRTNSKSNITQNSSSELPRVQKAVVEVGPSEILPVICWSKERNRTKLSKLKKSSKVFNDWNERNPLKFYLVDSRPEAAAREQGRLPTSVSLSPEKLSDFQTMKEQESMFESLRGSVHICIMGEGYSSLPELYGHKVTNALVELIKEDEERNDACARFFLSKGFPFVSLMEGGFAAAHAYLCREGPKIHLTAKNVLTDYNPEVSLFGRFEKLHSMSGRDKAQRALQNLFDSSMTALTINSSRLETFANGISDEQANQKGGNTTNAMKRFFGGKRGNSSREMSQDSFDPESFESGNIDTHRTTSFSQSSSESELKEKSSDSYLKKTPDAVPSPRKGLKKPSPFSRFGSLNIGQNMKRNDNTSGKSNKFAGSLNTFRKNTMARMIPTESRSEDSQYSAKTELNKADSNKQDGTANKLVNPVLAKV